MCGKFVRHNWILSIAYVRINVIFVWFQFPTKDRNSYFYIEKWTFKGMCEVYYRAKRDKKEATCL